jgi:eukaryotic-like serine/threonine-protein kinase
VSGGSGGKYRILAHLRGGDVTESSLVAVEGAAERLAVMKRLKLGADADAPLLERFAEEAKLCTRFDHPNLAKLLESGQDADGPVLVYEYLEGPTLARLRSRAFRRGTGIPMPIAIHIVREIAKGLAYAHSLTDEAGKPLKVVLRDVSPENVVVTYAGEVKLSDFGLATTVASTKGSRENRVRGNVAYMAPEQTRAEFSLDPRADIFALGVIMWELLAGKRLWEGLSEVDVLARLADETPLPSARSVDAEVPEAIDAICSMALSKVRDERYDSVEDFLEALDKATVRPEWKRTKEDVAAYVGPLFEDERAKMKSIVSEAREAAASGEDRPLAAIGSARGPDASPFVDAESDARLRFGVATEAEAPSKRVVEVIRIEPSSDRRFAYLMAALVVVVIGVVAIYLVTSPPKEEPKLESKPYVAPTRPPATAERAPSASVEPQEVTIELRVTPKDAKLFVDGVKTNNPYRTRVVPATFQHDIRAEAEGFEPRTMTVAFDRERSIEIALLPEEKKKPGQPAPPRK